MSSTSTSRIRKTEKKYEIILKTKANCLRTNFFCFTKGFGIHFNTNGLLNNTVLQAPFPKAYLIEALLFQSIFIKVLEKL
ncbi:CLUMA_CG019358, isoform A [Clunio marinus]|uniref:CLUMA_CG019358, isoform A n=1 Tax=Clunio marinus TaxID=568069 RepID=A0A1J1J1T9_9DIPT|nr:CLUMA_CG019358, isoform A [Clunio marinus]